MVTYPGNMFRRTIERDGGLFYERPMQDVNRATAKNIGSTQICGVLTKFVYRSEVSDGTTATNPRDPLDRVATPRF